MKTNKVWNKSNAILLLTLLLILFLFTGCGTTSTGEQAGKGFFRDVNFGMTLEEVEEKESARKDSGEPEQLLEYSCVCYRDVMWDGVETDIFYIANKDGEHLDTIMLNIDSGLQASANWGTLASLYTDGSAPEENDSNYFVWSNDEYVVVAQCNEDTSGIITLMLKSASDTDEAEEE